jgi:hypothetical protein
LEIAISGKSRVCRKVIRSHIIVEWLRRTTCIRYPRRIADEGIETTATEYGGEFDVPMKWPMEAAKFDRAFFELYRQSFGKPFLTPGTTHERIPGPNVFVEKNAIGLTGRSQEPQRPACEFGGSWVLVDTIQATFGHKAPCMQNTILLRTNRMRISGVFPRSHEFIGKISTNFEDKRA